MKPSESQANILAGQVLLVATQKVSGSFDVFSGWLVAGFGAAIALFITNRETVSSFASPATIKCAATLFVVSAALAIADKLLAAFISAGTTAGIEGAALGKELAKDKVEVDAATLFAETEKALFWPINGIAKRAFAKALSGDFAGPSRLYAKAGQIQALVVITQAILSLAAAVVVVYGLAV